MDPHEADTEAYVMVPVKLVEQIVNYLNQKPIREAYSMFTALLATTKDQNGEALKIVQETPDASSR